MKYSFSILILFILLSCGDQKGENEHNGEKKDVEQHLTFDSQKWKVKREGRYTYRDAMLNDLVTNKEIRKSNQNELFELLGKPDFYRDDSSYLYYKISEKKFGPVSFKNKTLVIKTLSDTIEWMKIHE